MGIFNYDSKFMQILGSFWDLLWLNLLTAVCSLPVFTFGASVTAMHHVLTQIVTEDCSGVTRSFFKSFKMNFRQATGLWLIFLLIAVLLLADYYWFFLVKADAPFFLLCILVLLTFLWSAGFVWLFPLISRYQNTARAQVKNSLSLFLAHPFMTLAMIVFLVCPAVFMVLNLEFGLLILLLLGYTGPGILSALLYSRVFARLEKKPAEQSESSESEQP